MKYLTWVELNREAYNFNMQSFKNTVGDDCKIMAIIKSNAYGHGLYESAILAQESKCVDMLGVYALNDAKYLYDKGVNIPIFIMGYVLSDDFMDIVKHDFSVCISSFDQLKKVKDVIGDNKIKIHLKFDSGLRRLGFYPSELKDLMTFLDENKNFIVEGIFSHFANIEDTICHDFAKLQRDTFEKMTVPFVEKYHPIRHIACSAAGLHPSRRGRT